MKKNAFWLRRPRVQRTRRPVAWRKNSSVTVLVANTPTRSRGMSTPSETMRTATIQGCSPSAKCSMRADAVGSSLTTRVACTPWRRRSSSTMPRACSWSMAMTRPPAWGCTARMAWSCTWAWSSTAGSHSPDSDSAVRRRWPERAWSRASSKVWAYWVPSGPTHSMWPSMRGK